MLLGKESHRADVGMLFRCQHEIDKEGNEPNRHQDVENRAAVFGDHLNDALWLVDAHRQRLLAVLWRVDDRAGLIR